MSFERQISNVFKVTIVITSCDRHELLFKTLASFVMYNTHPIEKIIIVEDSEKEINAECVLKLLTKSLLVDYGRTQLKLIHNGVNIGQLESIDKAYNEVNSEFIFHCEDDWEFYQSGFIEASHEILAVDDKIFTVWLRGHDDLNGHKINSDIKFTKNNITFHEIIPMGVWSGFTLNPGLRRKKDYDLLKPYARQKKIDKNLKNREKVTESDLSILYGDMGYYGVVSSIAKGYLGHIGQGHHIANVWENKSIVKLKNLVKRLLR
jgi:hypothetical protein